LESNLIEILIFDSSSLILVYFFKDLIELIISEIYTNIFEKKLQLQMSDDFDVIPVNLFPIRINFFLYYLSVLFGFFHNLNGP